MAKSSDVNKSEEIRALLKANPKTKAKNVVSKLAEQGIKISTGQVYFIKGTLKGRKNRAKKAVADAAATVASPRDDPVKTIMMVKSWAAEVGGLKKLKALVDALCE